MALIKQTTCKGEQCEYWAMIVTPAYNKIKNTTTFTLGLYRNKAKRDEDIEGNCFEIMSKSYEGNLNAKECFEKLKESVKQERCVEQPVPATYDDEGKELTPAKEAVIREFETSFFAGAKDA